MTTRSESYGLGTGSPNFGSTSSTGEDGKYIDGVSGPLKWNAYSKFSYTHSGTKDLVYHTYWMQLSALSSMVTYSVANIDNKSLNKLVDKVRNNDFNLASSLGESRQLVSLVQSNLSSISRAMLYNKHATTQSQYEKVLELLGIKSKNISYSKDVADRWLEMQYGWLPLIDDVYAAALAFEEKTRSRRAQIYRVSSSQFVPIETSADPGSYKSNGMMKVTVRYQYEFSEKLSQPRALGLENPLPALWEITPYSFAIDWFIPIGRYLDNLAIIPQLEGRWLKTVVKKVVGRGVPNSASPYYIGCSGAVDAISIERTTGVGFSAFSVPLPTVRPFVDAASGLHIANAVALATSVLQGGNPRQGF